MGNQLLAILEAQWRTLLNCYPRASRAGLLFTVVGSIIWYGGWFVGAVVAGALTAHASNVSTLQRVLAPMLFLACLYWQLVPILMASIGATLDMKRLIVYPIPTGSLFAIEVLLRVTTGVEVLLMLGGVAIGLEINPRVARWAPLVLVVFALFNMFLSAGVRDLLGRLMSRRRVRELSVIVLVLVSAAPQILFTKQTKIPPGFRAAVSALGGFMWPWTAAAPLAAGEWKPLAAAGLLAWVAAAYLFGRRQFERGLRFDEAAVQASDRSSERFDGLRERLFRLPSRAFHDPLGALVEKEIRFLTRSPRFRLLFLMGFTFGLLVWLPFTLGRRDESWMSANYLTVVCAYSLLMLGESAFWNSFGYDRSAAQNYFVLPVNFSTVLIAKNITGTLFVFLETAIVTIVCVVLRMPLTVGRVAEALGVTSVLIVFLLAAGNLASVYFPRPLNPAQSWKSGGAGKTQALLLLIYPLISVPITLAYLARWAFDSQLAFCGVLVCDFLFAATLYSISMESAVSAAGLRRESIVSALSQGEGPVSG